MFNECRGPSPRHSVWERQKRRSGGRPLLTKSDLTGLGIKPWTSRTDSDVLNHFANLQASYNLSFRRVFPMQ